MEEVLVYKTHVSTAYLIEGIINFICGIGLFFLGVFTISKNVIEYYYELWILFIFLVGMTFCLMMGIYLIKLYYQQGIVIYNNRLESFESRRFTSPRHIVYYYSDIECLNKTNRFFKHYITITNKSDLNSNIFIDCFDNFNGIYPSVETVFIKYRDVNK